MICCHFLLVCPECNSNCFHLKYEARRPMKPRTKCGKISAWGYGLCYVELYLVGMKSETVLVLHKGECTISSAKVSYLHIDAQHVFTSYLRSATSSPFRHHTLFVHHFLRATHHSLRCNLEAILSRLCCNSNGAVSYPYNSVNFTKLRRMFKITRFCATAARPLAESRRSHDLNYHTRNLWKICGWL